MSESQPPDGEQPSDETGGRMFLRPAFESLSKKLPWTGRSESNTTPTKADTEQDWWEGKSPGPIGRRELLVLGVTGALVGSGEVADAVVRDNSVKLNMATNDVDALLEDGEADSFMLGESTSLKFGWEDVAPNERIYIGIEVRPIGGSFETLSENYIHLPSSSGETTITAEQLFGESKRMDLTKHSEISTDLISIDDYTDGADIKETKFSLRTLVYSSDQSLYKTMDSSFTIRVGVHYGFGSQFAVNFGREAPEGF